MIHKMKKREVGFTLIEIIASITILGILIVILLPAFPNIMRGSSDAEDKMVSGNLMTRVVEDVKKSTPFNADFNITKCGVNSTGKDVPTGALPNNGKYQVDGKTFNVKLSVCQTPKEKEIDIVRTKIHITSPNAKESSETFTYIDK